MWPQRTRHAEDGDVVESVATREAGLRAPFVVAAGIHLALLVVVAARLTTRAVDEVKAAAE